ncbi:uncharacterized protein LOC104926961 [Larimichthys crocea]|uniref:uncharacterized protein LOC104926961 n=1 Tax=Larimichthys crocea TaxID=215358 RepID=UPI000F5EC384|nr:uncharacterized protein LOC104926961 [Larimichthys crocea]
MVAGCGASGALLLLMLLGTSYSYPKKQGFDPSSSYSSSYGANPPSTATWDMPSSGGSTPVVSGSVAGSKTVSSSAHPQNAPRREPSYPQPSERQQPAASSYSSNSFAAAHPGRASSSSAGSAWPSSSQPTSTQDIAWAVAPPSLGGTRPTARRFANKPASKPLGSSNVGPPGSRPEFQAGELSSYENRFEHGNYESETEEQGFQPAPPEVEVSKGRYSTSERRPLYPGRRRGHVFPYYDYMFLTGQYPQGTITHSSSSFEQGTDHWQDAHYIRYHYPASPGIPQVKTSVQQPSQPVKQSIDSNYGSGGAPEQNQPSGAVGPQAYSWRDPAFWINLL